MEAINMAKAREALEFIKRASDDYETYGTTKAGALDVIYEKACDALAAPARNCDVYDAKTAEKEFVRQTGSKSIRTKSVRWLYAPANGGDGDGK